MEITTNLWQYVYTYFVSLLGTEGSALLNIFTEFLTLSVCAFILFVPFLIVLWFIKTILRSVFYDN